MFLGIFPLLHCNARRRTNTIHLFAKKCVRRILNLLPCRLSCPYGVFKTPPLCFATQDIGEVSRSDGGVKFYNQNPIRRLSNPSPQKLPFLRSLPYILHCKTQGRSVESILVQKWEIPLLIFSLCLVMDKFHISEVLKRKKIENSIKFHTPPLCGVSHIGEVSEGRRG